MCSPPPHLAKFSTRPNVNTTECPRCTRLGPTTIGLAHHLPEGPDHGHQYRRSDSREGCRGRQFSRRCPRDRRLGPTPCLPDAIGLVDDVFDAAENLGDNLKNWASWHADRAFMRLARDYLDPGMMPSEQENCRTYGARSLRHCRCDTESEAGNSVAQSKRLSREELAVLRQNGISPKSKLVKGKRPAQAEVKGRHWTEEVAELRREVRKLDKRLQVLRSEIRAIEKKRRDGKPMTDAEHALRAERIKVGKLRLGLEHRANHLEYGGGKQTDFRFDSAVGVRRVLNGGLPSSKR